MSIFCPIPIEMDVNYTNIFISVLLRWVYFTVDYSLRVSLFFSCQYLVKILLSNMCCFSRETSSELYHLALSRKYKWHMNVEQ